MAGVVRGRVRRPSPACGLVGHNRHQGGRRDCELEHEDDLAGYSGVRPVENRHVWPTPVLVDGSRRYERLKVLLPRRPPAAVDCSHLAHPVFAEGKVICPECCGLGWVEPAGP